MKTNVPLKLNSLNLRQLDLRLKDKDEDDLELLILKNITNHC